MREHAQRTWCHRPLALWLGLILFFVFMNGCHDSSPANRNPLPSGLSISRFETDEHRFFARIQQAASNEERLKLIAEFESVPVQFHRFYSRWLVIHQVDPYACWTDQGYDPTASDLPRDIQLLEVTSYGKSDIDNGGLHQFFSNGTGTFAPEMVEWFERAGFPETADTLRKAIAVFGAEFPRSQARRQEFLDAVPGAYKGIRAGWDPFYELDDKFYGSIPNDAFEDAADRWLRETCGIRSLADPPPHTGAP